MANGHNGQLSPLVGDAHSLRFQPRSNPAEHDPYVEIPAPAKELFAKISPEDFDFVKQFVSMNSHTTPLTWQVELREDGTRYFHVQVSYETAKRKKVYLHRLIAFGDIWASSYLHVDHLNGDTLDNRRRNLRIKVALGNAHNRGFLPRTGFKGVYMDPPKKDGTFYPKPFRAVSQIGEYLTLGRFATREAAARARDSHYVKTLGKYLLREELNEILCFPLARKPKGMADSRIMARRRVHHAHVTPPRLAEHHDIPLEL